MFLPDLVARCAGLVLRFPISKAAVVVTSDQRFPGAGGADRDGLIFSHSLHGGGAESRDKEIREQKDRESREREQRDQSERAE